MEIKEELKKMVESFSDSKKDIIAFKELAVRQKNYELAAKLREIERNYFPKKSEDSKEVKDAIDFEVVLRMIGIEVDLKTAYSIGEVMKLYLNKGGNLDLRSVNKIKIDSDNIFL